MKKDEWYKEWFNTQQYLDLYKHRDDTDAKKVVKLLFKHIQLPKGSKTLDLACGNGRHSLLFAKKGLNVTGLDLSPYLISQAQKRLHKEYRHYSKRLKFVIGDMKHMNNKNEFDLVVNLFTSFGYFDTDKENFMVIKAVAGSLKTGGWFLFDFLNRDHLIKNIVPYDMKTIAGTVYIQIRHHNENHVIKNIFIAQNSSSGKPPKIHQYCEKIKLYSLSDFRKIFMKYGLKIKNVFGDYYGGPYNKRSSERLILLAQKT